MAAPVTPLLTLDEESKSATRRICGRASPMPGWEPPTWSPKATDEEEAARQGPPGSWISRWTVAAT